MKRAFVAVALLSSSFVVACSGSESASAAQVQIRSPKPTQVEAAAPALTPDQVRAAIEEKEFIFNHLTSKERFAVTISTPYTRVSDAAIEARAHYRNFTEADVTSDMVAPKVEIAAMLSGAVTIVIKPSKSNEERPIFQPLTFEPDTALGSVATFPLDALADSRTIHVVYVAPHMFCKDPGPTPETVECSIQIDMSKIR